MKQIENEVEVLKEQNNRLNEMIERNLKTMNILQQILEDTRSASTLANNIMGIVGIRHKKSIEDLLWDDRSPEFAIPRRMGIMVIKDLLNKGYVSIGSYFGKTHASILYQYNKWKECLKHDENLLKEYNELMELCRKEIFTNW